MKRNHGWRRVECPVCHKTFRSPTTNEWLQRPEYGLVTTEQFVGTTIQLVRTQGLIHPGLRQVKFNLCRQCSKRPSAPNSERRTT